MRRRFSLWKLIPILSVIVFLGNIPGCGPCYDERIEVRLPARIEVNGQARSYDLWDRAHPGNFRNFASFRSAIENARTTQAPAMAWTIAQGFGSERSWLAFFLDLPLQAGDEIPVRFASVGGGWGVVGEDFLPPGEAASVYLTLGSFQSASVNGTLLVLDATPLRLRADLEFRNAAGDTTVTVQGDIAFEHQRERIPCD